MLKAISSSSVLDTLHPRIPCKYNVFSNLHVYFNYNHINLRKTNDLQSSVSGKIFFQNHFIITFAAGIIFSAIYRVKILKLRLALAFTPSM